MATAKAIKISMFGLMSAVLMSAPAFAQNSATIDQSSDQQISQTGDHNSAAQGNMSTATVNQGTPGYYPFPYGYGSNSADIHQDNHQKIDQTGNANSATQGNMSTATVNQNPVVYPYPSFPYPVVVPY